MVWVPLGLHLQEPTLTIQNLLVGLDIGGFPLEVELVHTYIITKKA